MLRRITFVPLFSWFKDRFGAIAAIAPFFYFSILNKLNGAYT